MKEQKVEALYFSVDTEVDMWKKAIKEEGISNNQYLLSEDWKSSLCKFFQIQGIPHYVLFDKQHKIFMQNAPRPTDEGFEQLKSVVEKCK